MTTDPRPAPVIATILPTDAELLAVAGEARAAHLHLVTDGQRVMMAPEIPAGWHKMAVRVREARQ